MKINFIGGGNMARSIIGGILANKKLTTVISVCDPDASKLLELKNDFDIQTHRQTQIANDTEIVILAVKPQILPAVATAIKDQLPVKVIIISIVAGVTIKQLASWLGHDFIIIRTMPNTPALVQQGMTGIFSNSKLTPDQHQTIDKIFTSIGKTLWLETEYELNIVTAISGSGPAYFFDFFAAVVNAAEQLGMSATTASLLVQQTALGAATMAMQSKFSHQQLAQNVTSKGGTTEQALKVLYDNNFHQIISQTITAAFNRSIQLTNQENK